MSVAHAIFAAGCFWGVQSTFDSAPGVIETIVGYTGGIIDNPNYQMVCSESTGHAEAIKVSYDPKKISYEDLLDIFFETHDPTTKDRQGVDYGTQYRSAIFYLDNSQKNTAEKKISQLNKAGIFEAPIVTEVTPAGTFYPAEEYHQKYNEKKGQKSCSFETRSSQIVEEKWRKILSPEQYEVLRAKGTEIPFSGKLLNNTEEGTYICGACGNHIFKSDSKFDSHCGWPSFDKAIPGSIVLTPDFSHKMIRTEVTCSKCGSHLGHLFDDGPTETGERFCINSISMGFEKGK